MIVADVLIQAKNLKCGFDSRLAFRDRPVERNRTEEFVNMEKIAMELHAGKDDLLDRAVAQHNRLLPRSEEAVAPAFRAVNVRLSFVRRFGRVAA